MSDLEHEESLAGDESPATAEETRAELLERSGRDFTPINKLFVQAARDSSSRLGPLSIFVRNRDLRALRAELLLVGINSSGSGTEGWSTTLPIAVWARAFDATAFATSASAATAVSKILARLETRRLIERERRGRERKIRVTILREDGSGQLYTRPAADNTDRFLRLPHTYWLDGWYAKLDLPATAMLLVALHEKPIFELPTNKMQEWYGWSADTAERGFATLERLGLLAKTSRLKKAPLSPTGLARVNQYVLQGPFSQLPAPKKAPSKRVAKRRKKTTQ